MNSMVETSTLIYPISSPAMQRLVVSCKRLRILRARSWGMLQMDERYPKKNLVKKKSSRIVTRVPSWSYRASPMLVDPGGDKTSAVFPAGTVPPADKLQERTLIWYRYVARMTPET